MHLLIGLKDVSLNLLTVTELAVAILNHQVKKKHA